MRAGSLWGLVVVAVIGLSGCGGAPPSAMTASTGAQITVSNVAPQASATGVDVKAPITAYFSKAMDATQLSATTFTLTGPGSATISGAVTYSTAGSAASFNPNAALAFNTQYTATITTGATGSGGTGVASNFSWTFTTETAPSPTIMTTTPTDGTTAAQVSQTLTATFSEAMNPSTLTESTFKLYGPGSASIQGTVTYSSSTGVATFTPTISLTANTAYTATITTGAASADGASLAASYVWGFTTNAPANLAMVDFGTSYQTIRGFGTTNAWMGQLTSQQARALFNQSNGLGLSVLRVRIDPTGAAADNWIPSNGGWGWELNNATQAIANNPNAIVFASPWTPPASMKNSSTSQPYYNGTGACSPGAGYCGGYLTPSNYAAYANYLEDFVHYFQNGGVNLYAISLQNEPDYSNQPGENYESCSWTPQQMDAWVKANGSVLTTKLIMPESADFNPPQGADALSDSSAADLFSIVGGHLYGTSPSYYTQAENAGKEVWMTEHYLTPTGAQPAIGDALQAAIEIHNSMVTGQYSAYVWWTDWNAASAGINYGLITGNLTNPAPTYYGYALGQYARFIQPGYVRALATAAPTANVLVSAYSGSASGTQHYVIVAINSGSSAVSQSFAVTGGTVTSVMPYQTTAAGGLAAQSAVNVSSGNFTYTLPPQSITTFVQ